MSDDGMSSPLFLTISLITQTVAPEPAGAHEWRHHEHDGRAAAAQHDQVRLQQVWLCAGPVLPVAEPGGQTRVMS